MKFTEKLRKERIEKDKQFIYDEMEDETGMNFIECEGGMASLGTAPTPNAGRISAATVNGIAVPSKSNKKKKKKVNEELITIKEVTPEEMLEFIEDGFNIDEVLVTTVQNNREIIKVYVSYIDYGKLGIKYEYLDIDEETVIDVIEENNLTTETCLEQLQYLFKTHKPIHVYESINLKKEMNELKQLLS